MDKSSPAFLQQRWAPGMPNNQAGAENCVQVPSPVPPTHPPTPPPSPLPRTASVAAPAGGLCERAMRGGGGGGGGLLQVIGYGSNRYRLTDKDCNLKRPFYCAKKI